MADKERKPRARKKASAPQADGTPAIGNGDAPASDENALSLTSNANADGVQAEDPNDEPSATPSRTTIDQIHDSLQRPQSYGEVF